MPKYRVQVRSEWYYADDYEVEAENEIKAERLALMRHEEALVELRMLDLSSADSDEVIEIEEVKDA